MFSAKTLPDLLRQRADEHPQKIAFDEIAAAQPDDLEGRSLTYAGLYARACGVASALQAVCSPGERALLFYPNGLDYVCAFMGCLLAGVTAVPVYPPSLRRLDERIVGILADTSPTIVLTNHATLENRARLAQHMPGLGRLRWLDTADLSAAPPDFAANPAAPEDLAFLQYTSGSTRAPRGVMVTHANLMYNLAAISHSLEIAAPDRGVCWMPMHHDGGLIGNVLETIFCGGFCVLMPPLAFLQNPLTWLAAVSHYGATACGGPNFGYELCVTRTTPEQRRRLDLSKWRCAFNSAEPIHQSTLERFSAAFAPAGFSPNAFFGAYGLAESTLIVSGAYLTPQRLAYRCDQQSLAAGVAQPPVPGQAAALPVANGLPVEGTQVFVVDPLSRQSLPPRQVGEIWVAGPGVAAGYWGRSAESSEIFQARLADSSSLQSPACLRTGDLGFMDGGEVFITGRLKEMFIINGRNLYPQDILHSLIRLPLLADSLAQGGGAVFALEEVLETTTPSVVLVLEMRKSRLHALSPEALAGLLAEIRSVTAAEHQLALSVIYLTPPNSVPKTTSGKIRHQECRIRLLAGDLEILYSHKQDTHEEPPALEPLGSGEMLAYLRRQVSTLLGCSPTRVGEQSRLSDLGFRVSHAGSLRQRLNTDFGLDTPLTLPFDYPTLASLAGRLAELHAQKFQGAAAPMDAAPSVSLDDLSVDELAARLAQKLRQLKT